MTTTPSPWHHRRVAMATCTVPMAASISVSEERPMAVDATIVSPVVSGTSPVSNTSSGSSTSTTGIADNFQTFLTLLTTQLQNQNPLDPLDTNQFTQQLVQFAGVEQQLKSN